VLFVLVIQSAEVENQMVSVERLLEYTRLPVEEFDIQGDAERHGHTSNPVTALNIDDHEERRHVWVVRNFSTMAAPHPMWAANFASRLTFW
jgi:hypothetical protein